jgi:hypothetical protein
MPISRYGDISGKWPSHFRLSGLLMGACQILSRYLTRPTSPLLRRYSTRIQRIQAFHLHDAPSL